MLSTCCYACRIADYMLSPKSKLGGLSPPVYKVGGAIAPLAPPVPTPMAACVHVNLFVIDRESLHHLYTHCSAIGASLTSSFCK